MNFEKIFSFQKPNLNFYDILGCDPSSSIEQINKEYKVRALQLHPDKTGSDPDSMEKFKELQLAKQVLGDPKSRKTYDTWLSSGIQIPFEQYRDRNAHHSMHWAAPKLSNLTIKGVDNNGQGSDINISKSKSTNKL